MLLNGSELSKKIKNELKEEIKTFPSQPGLGIILVGDKPDSKIYVRMKKRACKFVGIQNFDINLPSDVTEEKVIEEVEKFNQNPDVHGILIQLPLPKHLNEQRILNKVSLNKDVDGFHLENVGKLTINSKDNPLVPCTPSGIIEILNRHEIKIEGKNVVVIGRSKIVGIPMAMLLLHSNATVTICHSRTKDYKEYTKNADIIVIAVGRPKMLKKEDIKQGAVIIDVGINRVDADNKKGYVIVGDADFDNLKEKAGAITPVPGGVGPMTIAMLLKHTTNSYKNLCISK